VAIFMTTTLWHFDAGEQGASTPSTLDEGAEAPAGKLPNQLNQPRRSAVLSQIRFLLAYTGELALAGG
jgi:hypothetical protein